MFVIIVMKNYGSKFIKKSDSSQKNIVRWILKSFIMENIKKNLMEIILGCIFATPTPLLFLLTISLWCSSVSQSIVFQGQPQSFPIIDLSKEVSGSRSQTLRAKPEWVKWPRREITRYNNTCIWDYAAKEVTRIKSENSWYTKCIK